MAKASALAQAIGPRLTIKTTNDVPPFSLVHVDKGGVDSFFRVQLNFMHSRISRDRPVFTVYQQDSWDEAFVDEFDEIWHEGAPFDRSSVPTTLGERDSGDAVY